MALTDLLFTADGRISRADFWKGIGIVAVLAMVASILIAVSDERQNPLPLLGACFIFFVVVWAWFTLTWKRCMARSYSAWWFMFGFVPVVGWAWAIVALGVIGDDAE